MLIALGALAGLLLGALTRWVDNLPDGWRSLALIGSPWLGLAFALGALTVLWGGRRVVAAIGGAVATVGAVLGYYGYMHVVEHEANAYYLTFWLVPAVLGGPLFGLAGAAWHDGSARLKALAVGLLGALCVGEGGLDTLASLGAHHSADAVSVAELALGLTLCVSARAARPPHRLRDDRRLRSRRRRRITADCVPPHDAQSAVIGNRGAVEGNAVVL